jgi:serine/threonine protein kinase
VTGRDPRSPGFGGRREPTQSLNLGPDELDDDEDDDAHRSVALGTHRPRDEETRVEKPSGPVAVGARNARAASPPPVPRNPDDPEERVGATLGSYKLGALLGKGGMGYVYRAEHTKLGREVALKLLRMDYARRRDAVARFFQEARTVNRVRHRNIVDVTDFVELDDGTTYIIMELLDGTSLGKWARTGIELPRALGVLVQICDGLAAAHQVGVVHRDLKPDNVIVVPTEDGAEVAKLLDFGVAKLLNRDDEDIGFQTAAGSVIGTPAYMSPEQAGGLPVDARSDIYSLGAIMYELFTGQPMFRGRSFGEYVRKHLTENPVPPRQTPRGGDLDPRLEALILRSLEKDPARRHGDIVELRDALLGILGGLGPAMVVPAVMTSTGLRPLPQMAQRSQALAYTAPGSAAVPSLASLPVRTSQPSAPASTYVVPQPTPWWVWGLGGAIAVVVGASAAIWYAKRDPSAASAPAIASVTPAPVAVAPTPPPEPQRPIVTPAPELPKPVVTPAPIELRFDSTPSASVFAEGHAAELCRTPCSFHVDTSDGGPADSRAFRVRAAGYEDQLVTVELAGQQREFHVALARTPAPAAPAPHHAGATPKHPPVEHVDPDALAKPDPTPPPPPKKHTGPAIDPSDTMDPFKH